MKKRASEDGRERPSAAKERLLELLDEMIARLDDAFECDLIGPLMGLSLRIAEAAAIYGLAIPPVEHIITDLSAFNSWLGISPPLWSSFVLRVNDPDSGGGHIVRVDDPRPTRIEADEYVYQGLAAALKNWKRALDRRHLSGSLVSVSRRALELESIEWLVFEGQLAYERAGRRASFFEEVGPILNEVYRAAQASNMSRAEFTSEFNEVLQAHMAKAVGSTPQSVDECIQEGRFFKDGGSAGQVSRVGAEERAPNQIRFAGESRGELRSRAEEHVKASGFPGTNELARQLGCASSSLSNAIEESVFLKARRAEYEASKARKPREQSLTDVNLGQAQQQREASPVEDAMLKEEQQAELAKLVAEQQADQRADCRKRRSKYPNRQP